MGKYRSWDITARYCGMLLRNIAKLKHRLQQTEKSREIRGFYSTLTIKHSTLRAELAKVLGMKTQVIFDEAGDKVVAVIVTGLHAQG